MRTSALPYPGDTITAFGAFLVGIGRLHYVGVFVSTTIGSLAGFMFLFWIGNLLGKRFFIEKDFRFFKAKDIVKAEAWFEKYGYTLVLINRFLPGVRSVIALAAGFSRFKALKVTTLALLSCMVWNFIWIYLGFTLGTNWDVARQRLEQILAHYNIALVGLATLVILAALVRRFIRKRA